MPDTAILLCPYNHSQPLQVGADGTSTYPRDPSQEEENDYKKGSKEKQKGDPQHTRGTRKSSSDLAEDQIFSVKLGL